jgi:hypothetical protein
MELFYACKAGINGGIARCLNDEGRCPSHPLGGNWLPAPRPSVVFLRFNLNPRWYEIFAEREHVQIEYRSPDERKTLETQRALQAYSLRRNNVAYNQRSNTTKSSPESVMNGCNVVSNLPVPLRKEGLVDAKVSVHELPMELRQAGFVPTWVSILKMDGLQPKLVTAWSEVGIQPEVELPNSFTRLANAAFNVVHIQANPRNPKKENRADHSVACARRDEVKSQHSLHYDSGDWTVTPVSNFATVA